MSRVKGGPTSHARHRKVIKQAAGYYGARSTNYRTAKQAVDKALQYATRDRKTRKRKFRALWIQRINAAVREHDAESHLLPPDRRPEQGRHRGRPQGARRPRRARAGRLRRHRRPGEVRPRLTLRRRALRARHPRLEFRRGRGGIQASGGAPGGARRPWFRRARPWPARRWRRRRRARGRRGRRGPCGRPRSRPCRGR